MDMVWLLRISIILSLILSENNTYIQSEGINYDFGLFDCPDDLLQEHRQEMSAFKAFL